MHMLRNFSKRMTLFRTAINLLLYFGIIVDWLLIWSNEELLADDLVDELVRPYAHQYKKVFSFNERIHVYVILFHKLRRKSAILR